MHVISALRRVRPRDYHKSENSLDYTLTTWDKVKDFVSKNYFCFVLSRISKFIHT